MMKQRFTLMESQINVPQSKETFTFAKFGMTKGARLLDRLEGKLLVETGTGLVVFALLLIAVISRIIGQRYVRADG